MEAEVEMVIIVVEEVVLMVVTLADGSEVLV
jgi:hypothetical protein